MLWHWKGQKGETESFLLWRPLHNFFTELYNQTLWLLLCCGSWQRIYFIFSFRSKKKTSSSSSFTLLLLYIHVLSYTHLTFSIKKIKFETIKRKKERRSKSPERIESYWEEEKLFLQYYATWGKINHHTHIHKMSYEYIDRDIHTKMLACFYWLP